MSTISGKDAISNKGSVGFALNNGDTGIATTTDEVAFAIEEDELGGIASFTSATDKFNQHDESLETIASALNALSAKVG